MKRKVIEFHSRTTKQLEYYGLPYQLSISGISREVSRESHAKGDVIAGGEDSRVLPRVTISSL